MKRILIACFFPVFIHAQQIEFERSFDVAVAYGATTLLGPWMGGLNAVQISEIDLNFDGLKDLFVFDRAVDKPFTFINTGSGYVYDASYESQFPQMNSWALLRDFNCDGLEDIFTYATGGIQVFRNTSDAINGISFVQETSLILSQQGSNLINLYVSSIDIPAIDDIDGDGDLDVLTFNILGFYLEYHKNLSVENYGNCNHLEFELKNSCWGHFSESGLGTNEVTLNDNCSNVTNPELGENGLNESIKKHGVHSGSTVLSIDIDGNGVKDLILGDATFSTSVMLLNGGTAPNQNSAMVSQDVSFPSYNVPIDVKYFPAHFYVDVDNDGIRDLMVSPNNRLQSENAHSIFFYKNIGTNAAPVFSYQKNNFLQEDMIDVGSSSYPAAFDYNNDGLMDLVVGNYGYYDNTIDQYVSRLMLLENIGTITNPEFKLVDSDYLKLSQLGFKETIYPAFGDIDNDGDVDLIVGDLNGNLHYFENTGGSGVANLQLKASLLKDDLGNTIDVGLFAYPFLFDVDNDGDLDLIIGERRGKLSFYENIGELWAPKFKFITDSWGGVDVKQSGFVEGHSKPCLFRDRAGEVQLFVGSEEGVIHHYNNIKGNLLGTFNEEEYSVANINLGRNSALMLYDYNDDGKYDMIVGNVRGGLVYYNGLTETVGTKELTNLSFKLFPNPTSGRVSFEFTETTSVEIYSIEGKLHKQFQLERGVHSIELNLPKALYFVKVSVSNGASSTVKLLVN
jgi:hypothetical protein